ncbi:MAG TPA: hypothetical protein ENN73_03900 [Firmicutes bacterium]|nr:hypothetical protein [Bacillota bacterium]
MKHFEKVLLESVYSKIFNKDHRAAVNILRELLDRKDLSDEFKEIVQFKIADILFQDKEYKKVLNELKHFIISYPASSLIKIANERLDFIQKQGNL